LRRFDTNEAAVQIDASTVEIMNWVRRVQCQLNSLIRKEKLDHEMDQELQSHVEMQTQENLASGMSPEEAGYAALRAFGNPLSIKERAQDERGTRWLEDFAQDVRFGVRMLWFRALLNRRELDSEMDQEIRSHGADVKRAGAVLFVAQTRVRGITSAVAPVSLAWMRGGNSASSTGRKV
jgi:hypothetical protein